jgi:Cu-processing system permease protein
MRRVARALVVHEIAERARDRWVLVISVLFALLSSGVSLYARSAQATAQALVGPSLVTLASLLVPLVALVLGHDAIVGERERNTLGLLLSLPIGKAEVVVAKYLGRLGALSAAVVLGIGVAVALSPPGQGEVLADLFVPTLLLGASFLSLGLLLSVLTLRQLTAASLVVATWFLLVFFYDLGILGLLVVTDGAIPATAVSWLVMANPAGLFRLEMMERYAGPQVLETLGVSLAPPGLLVSALLWGAFIVVPVALSAARLSVQKIGR